MFQKGVDYWAQKELALTKRKIELQGSLETVEVEAGVALLDAEESGSSGASASFDKLDRTRGEVRPPAPPGQRGRGDEQRGEQELEEQDHGVRFVLKEICLWSNGS